MQAFPERAPKGQRWNNLKNKIKRKNSIGLQPKYDWISKQLNKERNGKEPTSPLCTRIPNNLWTLHPPGSGTYPSMTKMCAVHSDFLPKSKYREGEALCREETWSNLSQVIRTSINRDKPYRQCLSPSKDVITTALYLCGFCPLNPQLSSNHEKSSTQIPIGNILLNT